jgi:AhpD family alkylhydroperoxidase
VLISESTLPTVTQNLVMIRASQINGDGYATDVHSKNAAHAGESATRLNLVAVWRESTVFTDAERYDQDQLATLVAFIALINATDRFAVINRQRGGDYTPA